MSKISKVISTQKDNLSRFLIKILSLGNDDVQEIKQSAPYGDDSNPIKDTIAVYSETNDSGESVVVGYINKNQITSPGEKRIFSTDSDGNVKIALYLKNNGTAEFGGNAKHMVRYEELETAFNQLKSDFNNHVTTYNSHTHITTATVLTGPPGIIAPTTSTGTPSSADITGAKITEIKTL